MYVQDRLDVRMKRDHVAIMRKDWGLTQKIITGKKKIETRWYKNKAIPWDGIFPGDTVYFKDSGEPVSVKANVSEVEQFADLTPSTVIQLLSRLAKDDGLGVDEGSLKKFYYLFEHKRYCIVIHLENPTEVEPFEIDKTGFGMQAAWLTTDNINRLKQLDILTNA